jgi:PEP-CTERM/exosortase A-associated glycosyltransferase
VRVLHVLDHSLPLHSGYVFRTQGILTEQRHLGIETFHVTSAKHPDSRCESEAIGEFEYHRTIMPPSFLDRLPGVDQLRVVSTLATRLEKLVGELRPDVIHAHSPCLNGLAALRVARKHGIPLVYELRASWEDAAVSHGTTVEGSVRYRLSRALETFVLRRAQAVVTICEGLRQDVIARGVERSRVTVVPNAVDRELLEYEEPNAPLPDVLRSLAGRRTIGFFGSFYSYEGLDQLLAAIATLRDSHDDIALILLGSGPEDAKLKAQAERLGLGRHVVFLGRVPHEDVARFYRHIDVFVFPRRRMRLTDLVTPLKPLEAMSAEALVIGSDVGGHRELITDGATGVLFRADDVEALRSALIEVFAEPERFRAVREAGRRFVTNERTWPHVAKSYCGVYGALSRG